MNRARRIDQGRNIYRDQAPFHGLSQRGPQDGVEVLDGSSREPTLGELVVEETLDARRIQLGEWHRTERWKDMDAQELAIACVRLRAHRGLDRILQPSDQELPERLAPACHEKSPLPIRQRRGHPRGYLVPRSPIDELPPTAVKAKGGAPSAVAASDDRSFAVTASPHRFVPFPSLKMPPPPRLMNTRDESAK